MELAEIYSTCRTRLTELGPTLSAEQLDARLPATPPWTVADGYRHLTGVCVDVLDGVMEGAGSAEWTAAQLAQRSDRSIDQVCAEWNERGPQLEAQVAAAGTAMAFCAFDAWTHGQDIRAAVGVPAQPDDDLVVSLAEIAVSTFGRRYAGSGAPALRIVFAGTDHVLGDGDPALTLNTTAYELLRIIFGRRSRSQIEEADWSGADPTAAIDALHLFDCPDEAIID